MTQRDNILDRLKQRTFACVVIDEAHGVITQEFRSVLEALGLKKQHRWLPMPGAPLLIGLTATPWRKSDEQDASLHRFFSNNLVTSTSLGTNPVAKLQERGVLSLVDHDRIQVDWVPSLNYQQQAHFEKFHELPNEYLGQLAKVSSRNAEIVKRLIKLKPTCKTLVFACSIEHSEVLAACLNVALGAGAAISVTSATARNARSLAIESFRQADGPRYLCTVGVLAAGFDAPKVAAVVITRPTMSAALYEQMVGRGLRGPLNGGTKRCRVIDVQDDGLPEGILSYARVIDRWTNPSRALDKKK
jgi:DNA repair protein RadD